MTLIIIYRTPGLMMVDKTGDVEKADQLLQDIREKERLKRAKGDVMFRLQSAMDTGQVDMLEHMIKGKPFYAARSCTTVITFLICLKTNAIFLIDVQRDLTMVGTYSSVLEKGIVPWSPFHLAFQ